jgi:hypothetical protein
MIAFRSSCALLFATCVLLVACGGGSMETSPEQAPPPRMVDISVTGQTVTKVRATDSVIAFLQERLNSIFEDGPQRTLVLVSANGEPLQPYTTPAGWSLVDFVVHPSGDLSVVLTSSREVRLVRLDHNGAVRSDQSFSDPVAATDPFFNYAGGLKDDGSLQPVLMHDAARLTPLGESLLLVLRTGRNAVVAYRLDPDASGAYRLAWRTLVEPGASIFLRGIYSGTFDVFGQLQNHIRVFADVDTAGTLAIGLVEVPQANFTFQAHMDYFNEPITATVGVLVTRVRTQDGRRLGSTVIDTGQLGELHGLRATSRGFALVGRVFSEVLSDGSGWDAFATFVGSDGTPGPYNVVDVDRGDVLFDIAQLSSGQYIALGTTGYVENPTGYSISESANPLLVLLSSTGSLAQNLSFPSGPRHNQLTTLARVDGHWLLGGMLNGPGTHSGDTDRSLLSADGFLREPSDLPD